MPRRGLVHAAHAAHATHIGHGGHVLLGFGLFGNGAFGGQEQGSHGSGVLQSDTGHLLGVDDAGLDESSYSPVAALKPKPSLPSRTFPQPRNLHGQRCGDEAQGFFKGTADDVEAGQFVVVAGLMSSRTLMVRTNAVPPPGSFQTFRID